MGTVETMAFGAGIVVGSLLLVAVAVVWMRKQAFGIARSVMCLSGVILVGLTVWRTVQFEITENGFKGTFDRLEQQVTQLNEKVVKADAAVQTIATTNAALLRGVATLNRSVTSTSEHFRALTDELAQRRTVPPDRAAVFRDSVVVPQLNPNVFEERARQLERAVIQ